MKQILLITLTLSVSAGASNSEDAKKCAETVGVAESRMHAAFKDLKPKTAGEFIELYHPERIRRFKMPFHLNLFAKNHSQVAQEYFPAILPYLPYFFALRPTVEEVIRLFDVTSSFELGSLSKDGSTWRYTRAFLKAMAALTSDYFDNLYLYKSALAEVSVEARGSRDPKIMDFKDEMVLKRPTWTYQQILKELNIQSVEVPASALAKVPDSEKESDEPPVRQAPASARNLPSEQPVSKAPAASDVPPGPSIPKQPEAAPPPAAAAPSEAPRQAPSEPPKSGLIGTTNTGTAFYILKTLFSLWRESKRQ